MDRDWSAYSFKSDHTSLRLLDARRTRRLRVEPYHHKRNESTNDRPQPSNPGPASANPPAARILIVSKVADSHLVLLLDVGEEGALVVDAEGEDAVLIGHSEMGAENGAVFSPARRSEIQPVEGRQHGEFQLQFVTGGNLEWNEPVTVVLGDFDMESLYCQSGPLI